jgi:hypothetical protein
MPSAGEEGRRERTGEGGGTNGRDGHEERKLGKGGREEPVPDLTSSKRREVS